MCNSVRRFFLILGSDIGIARLTPPVLFHETAPPLRLGLGAGPPGPTCADDGRYYFVRPGYFALASWEKLSDGQPSPGVAPLSLAQPFKLNLTANWCIQFHKRSQLFVSAEDGSHSVAMRIHNPDCSPFEIDADNSSPKLEPACGDC